MIQLLKAVYNQELWPGPQVVVPVEEVGRVNNLLQLFERYVEHICSEEGTNYGDSWKFSKEDKAILDSICKGHLD